MICRPLHTIPVFISFLVVFALLACPDVYARQIEPADTVFQQKMRLHAHPSGLLFVHTDKTIYTNNETIWYSSYLIKTESAGAPHHTFMVAVLVREDNRKISLQQKYIMENGVAFGSLHLPDTIAPGDYSLIVYTNVLDKQGQPIARFTQPLTIKSITQRSFHATLELLDSNSNNEMVRARVVLIPNMSNSGNKINGTLEYNVGKHAARPVTFEGSSYIINIPRSQLSQSRPVLFTSVTYNNEVQYLSIPLPEEKREQLVVKFFPEGGHLADGLESVVGWECRTSENFPLSIKAILYRDGIPIDTIATTATGVGTFRLKPENKSRYVLKPFPASISTTDTAWQLPQVLANGVVLQVPTAVVNDSIRINLFSREPRVLRVLIHNYHEIFLSFTIPSKLTGTKVMAALPQMPKGIAIITVLDEQERPVAERLFFVNYDQQVVTDLQADKPMYGKKERVTVRLRSKDTDGNPVRGLVSVAVVQDNRIESSKQLDIGTYSYLSYELGNIPKAAAGRLLDQKDLLNEILLIKGWRRYSWQNLISSKAADTFQNIRTPFISAKVLQNDKPLKKPVPITILRNGQVDLDSTDHQGTLLLTPDKLLVEESRKLYLFVSSNNRNVYSINVVDPFIPLNQQLSEELEIIPRGSRPKGMNSKEQELTGMEKAQILQSVVVTSGRGDNALYGAKANPCGDYVCVFNVLNCPRHFNDPRNKEPEKTRRYRNGTAIKMSMDRRISLEQLSGETGQSLEELKYVWYDGCTVNDKGSGVEGIYTAREFYGLDTDPDAGAEPQFLSTLHWEPASLLSPNGEKEFSFFTGDITGKFRIVVQGVSVPDLIFAESYFSVR